MLLFFDLLMLIPHYSHLPVDGACRVMRDAALCADILPFAC